MQLDVLTPNSNINKTLTNIAAGSGIVAGPFIEGVRRVYFEGNVYGACNLHDFDQRLLIAGFRLRDAAPTIAFTIEFEHDRLFDKVGTFDMDSHTLTATSPDKLNDWASAYQS